MKENSTSFGGRKVTAGIIGNVLEWYDFAVYGYFATILSGLFFPEEDKVVALIATYGIFAAGFLMRPIGGMIFGVMGDKLGRKKALTASVILMALPTSMIGLLPTYESIGMWAALLLTVLRLLQGLSVGGELTGSISFIVENAPQDRRGFFGSWTIVGAVGGILLGSLVGMLLTLMMDAEALSNWGWRLPFLAGILIGIVGLILRRDMNEGEDFEKLKASGQISKSPLKEFFRDHTRTAIVTVFSIWCFAVSFYMLFVYLASYTHTFLGFKLEEALSINTFSMVILMGIILLMGHLSDKFGRKKVLIAGFIGFIIFSVPLFMIIDLAEYWHIQFAQIAFAFIVGTQQGVFPAALVERFPTRIRYTGLSVSYNFALAIFGGTTPMLATWLIHISDGDILMPCYYLMFSAIVSLIAVSKFEETYKKKLE